MFVHWGVIGGGNPPPSLPRWPVRRFFQHPIRNWCGPREVRKFTCPPPAPAAAIVSPPLLQVLASHAGGRGSEGRPRAVRLRPSFSRPRRKNGNSRAREHGLACHRRRSFDLGSFCRRCWIFAFCPFSHRTNDAVSGGPLGAGACCMIIFGKQKKTGRPIPTTCWRKRGHD